jgi:HK97 family phage portal protein
MKSLNKMERKSETFSDGAIGTQITSSAYGDNFFNALNNISIKKFTKQWKLQAILRCVIDKIVLPFSNLKPIVWDNKKKEEAKNHDFYRLIKRPNGYKSWQELMEGCAYDYYIFSVFYIEVQRGSNGTILNLKRLHPMNITCIEWNEFGDPTMWQITDCIGQFRYVPAYKEEDPRCTVFKCTFYNPDNAYNKEIGFAPIWASQKPLDLVEDSQDLNGSFMANGARSSGAFIMKGGNGHDDFLSDEQYYRIKKELEDSYAGAANAGSVMLLDGGLTYTDFTKNLADMEFSTTFENNLIMICLAHGIDPQLVLWFKGGGSRYGVDEMIKLLYYNIVFPLGDKIYGKFNDWFVDKTNIKTDDRYELRYDDNRIGQIYKDKIETIKIAKDTSSISINEIRGRMNLGAVEGGEEVRVSINDAPISYISKNFFDAKEGDVGNKPPKKDPAQEKLKKEMLEYINK